MPNKEDKVFLVANYFLKKNEEDGKGLDPKKMQKLLYYAQAWNLVLNHERLFRDEFQAWVHGPAIPRVWQTFREFNFIQPHPEILKNNFMELDKKEKGVLDMVWGVYGKYDGNYLEVLTHSEAPWQEARKDVASDKPSQNIISTDMMKRFYAQRLTETTAARA